MSTLFYILYCNPARMLKILLCKYTISNTGFMPKWNIRHAGNVMSTFMTFWWVHLQKVASIVWPGIIWEETREITSVRFKFLSHHHNSRANNQELPMQYITTSTDFVLVTTWWLTAIYLTIFYNINNQMIARIASHDKDIYRSRMPFTESLSCI